MKRWNFLQLRNTYNENLKLIQRLEVDKLNFNVIRKDLLTSFHSYWDNIYSLLFISVWLHLHSAEVTVSQPFVRCLIMVQVNAEGNLLLFVSVEKWLKSLSHRFTVNGLKLWGFWSYRFSSYHLLCNPQLPRYCAHNAVRPRFITMLSVIRFFTSSHSPGSDTFLSTQFQFNLLSLALAHKDDDVVNIYAWNETRRTKN